MNKGRMPVAILYSYIGTGLHGLQLNKSVPTIEDFLFLALIDSNLIPDRCARNLNEIKLSEASHTDSGVYAAAQVISCWLTLPRGLRPWLLPRVNIYSC
jgi:tRNA pseudouridine(38-40) synthase